MSNHQGKNPAAAVNPIEVEKYLKGIKFPAQQEDLVRHAQQNHAPAEVLQTIKQFVRKEYHSAAEVAKAFGEIQ